MEILTNKTAIEKYGEEADVAFFIEAKNAKIRNSTIDKRQSFVDSKIQMQIIL